MEIKYLQGVLLVDQVSNPHKISRCDVSSSRIFGHIEKKLKVRFEGQPFEAPEATLLRWALWGSIMDFFWYSWDDKEKCFFRRLKIQSI